MDGLVTDEWKHQVERDFAPLCLAVVPQWAIDVGLPEPDVSESFEAYCERLGLDPGRFTDGLTETTAEFANLRLAHALREENVVLDIAFRHHARARRDAARRPPEASRRGRYA